MLQTELTITQPFSRVAARACHRAGVVSITYCNLKGRETAYQYWPHCSFLSFARGMQLFAMPQNGICGKHFETLSLVVLIPRVRPGKASKNGRIMLRTQMTRLYQCFERSQLCKQPLHSFRFFFNVSTVAGVTRN